MSDRTAGESATAGTIVLAVLSAAMFIYVIDTTIMNVSITALVEDLGTTVDAVHAAITIYTLTMAAFMLTGGKVGDIWGSKRAVRIGLVIYGIGTTITALAPNIGFVILGWSILEGLGAALIVPAINTLVRSNFAAGKRASAYGVIFGVAAAGAAFGPLIGGWITTTYTWRLAFALEAVIVLIVLATSGLLADSKVKDPRPKLDGVGSLLSVLGMGALVLGILVTAERGWRDPVVVTMILAGLGLLAVFSWWVRRRERLDLPALIHPSIFRHRAVGAGLPVLAAQTFAQGGILFLVPLFAQVMLGLDAFETGLTILPLSIAVLVVSIASPKLGRYIYPKWIVQAGLIVLFVGGWLVARSMFDATEGSDLAFGLVVVGIGIGLIVAQLPNLILSSVEAGEASEASGLTGTSQNLGMALGIALVGSVILVVSAASFSSRVESSETLTGDQMAVILEQMERDIALLGTPDFELAAAAAPVETRTEVLEIIDDSMTNGFQAAIIVGGFVALLGFFSAFFLPKRKLPRGGIEQSVRSNPVPQLQLEMQDL